jgi:predicted Zn-dependent protease
MLVAFSAGAAAPVRADMFKPSEKDQIKLGDQAAQEVIRKYRVIHDGRARRVEDVGYRLLDALSSKERGPWDYHFYLIDSKEVNAFALPGGNVFMFTGLYDRMHSEDELAGVMGHELTHVRKEHWANMAAAQQKRQAGLLVILGVTHASKGWQSVAGLADNLLTLKYSRGDEDQADSEGLKDMVAAGYNPRGMLDLFHTLQESSGGGGGPSFLADHPLTKQRIDRTQERINNLGSRNFPPETPLR